MGKCCRLSAVYANSGQFVNLFSERHKVNDVSEWLSLESAIQGGDYDNDSTVGEILSDFDNILEELSFVNSDNVILHGFVLDIVQL